MPEEIETKPMTIEELESHVEEFASKEGQFGDVGAGDVQAIFLRDEGVPLSRFECLNPLQQAVVKATLEQAIVNVKGGVRFTLTDSLEKCLSDQVKVYIDDCLDGRKK